MDEDYDDDEFAPNEEGLLNRGEVPIDGLDDANVPVDIWFEELKEADDLYKLGYRFTLRCGNYMPRKGRVEDSAVEVFAKDRETLQKAVEKYIVPHYQLALRVVTKIAKEGKGNLYYWNEDKDE